MNHGQPLGTLSYVSYQNSFVGQFIWYHITKIHNHCYHDYILTNHHLHFYKFCLAYTKVSGGNTDFFGGGGGSTKKCDHDCDQALIKSSWESVQSILVSWCFGYIGVTCEHKMNKNTKFSSSSSCQVYENLSWKKIVLIFWVPIFSRSKAVTDVKNSLY